MPLLQQAISTQLAISTPHPLTHIVIAHLTRAFVEQVHASTPRLDEFVIDRCSVLPWLLMILVVLLRRTDRVFFFLSLKCGYEIGIGTLVLGFRAACTFFGIKISCFSKFTRRPLGNCPLIPSPPSPLLSSLSSPPLPPPTQIDNHV